MSVAVFQRATSDAAQARTSMLLGGGIGAAWLVIHFGGIFGPAVSDWPVAGLLAVIAVQTWLSTGLFIIAHDCMHGAFAPGRPAVNRWVGRVALMSYAGIDYDRMTPKHFAHHRHAGSADDPDFNADDPHRPGPWLRRFFATYYTHWQLARIVIVLSAYQLFGASLLNCLAFWAVPALLAVAQLFYFGTYLPHRHGEDFADRHRARSVGGGGLGSLLSCFHFGGYHHEHHLSPHTPWWRLPNVRDQARSSAAAR